MNPSASQDPCENWENYLILSNEPEAQQNSNMSTMNIRNLGLKELSKFVHQMIKELKVTTQEEIVKRLIESSPFMRQGELSSLKRRIYDCVSVLQALNFIVKDKKVLYLKQDNQFLAEDLRINKELLNQIKNNVIERKLNFRILTKKHQNLEKLIARNKYLPDDVERYYFPLLKVTTKIETPVEMTENLSHTEITFDSKAPFNLDGDLDIIIDLSLD